MYPLRRGHRRTAFANLVQPKAVFRREGVLSGGLAPKL